MAIPALGPKEPKSLEGELERKRKNVFRRVLSYLALSLWVKGGGRISHICFVATCVLPSMLSASFNAVKDVS